VRTSASDLAPAEKIFVQLKKLLKGTFPRFIKLETCRKQAGTRARAGHKISPASRYAAVVIVKFLFDVGVGYAFVGASLRTPPSAAVVQFDH